MDGEDFAWHETCDLTDTGHDRRERSVSSWAPALLSNARLPRSDPVVGAIQVMPR